MEAALLDSDGVATYTETVVVKDEGVRPTCTYLSRVEYSSASWFQSGLLLRPTRALQSEDVSAKLSPWLYSETVSVAPKSATVSYTTTIRPWDRFLTQNYVTAVNLVPSFNIAVATPTQCPSLGYEENDTRPAVLHTSICTTPLSVPHPVPAPRPDGPRPMRRIVPQRCSDTDLSIASSWPVQTHTEVLDTSLAVQVLTEEPEAMQSKGIPVPARDARSPTLPAVPVKDARAGCLSYRRDHITVPSDVDADGSTATVQQLVGGDIFMQSRWTSLPSLNSPVGGVQRPDLLEDTWREQTPSPDPVLRKWSSVPCEVSPDSVVQRPGEETPECPPYSEAQSTFSVTSLDVAKGTDIGRHSAPRTLPLPDVTHVAHRPQADTVREDSIHSVTRKSPSVDYQDVPKGGTSCPDGHPLQDDSCPSYSDVRRKFNALSLRMSGQSSTDSLDVVRQTVDTDPTTGTVRPARQRPDTQLVEVSPDESVHRSSGPSQVSAPSDPAIETLRAGSGCSSYREARSKFSPTPSQVARRRSSLSAKKLFIGRPRSPSRSGAVSQHSQSSPSSDPQLPEVPSAEGQEESTDEDPPHTASPVVQAPEERSSRGWYTGEFATISSQTAETSKSSVVQTKEIVTSYHPERGTLHLSSVPSVDSGRSSFSEAKRKFGAEASEGSTVHIAESIKDTGTLHAHTSSESPPHHCGRPNHPLGSEIATLSQTREVVTETIVQKTSVQCVDVQSVRTIAHRSSSDAKQLSGEGFPLAHPTAAEDNEGVRSSGDSPVMLIASGDVKSRIVRQFGVDEATSPDHRDVYSGWTRDTSQRDAGGEPQDVDSGDAVLGVSEYDSSRGRYHVTTFPSGGDTPIEGEGSSGHGLTQRRWVEMSSRAFTVATTGSAPSPDLVTFKHAKEKWNAMSSRAATTTAVVRPERDRTSGGVELVSRGNVQARWKSARPHR